MLTYQQLFSTHNIFFVKQFTVSIELDFNGLIFCGLHGIGERMQNYFFFPLKKKISCNSTILGFFFYCNVESWVPIINSLHTHVMFTKLRSLKYLNECIQASVCQLEVDIQEACFLT